MSSDREEGTEVAAGPRLNNGEGSTDGSVGRKGRNAFGEDVVPVPGLGPGFRGVVGSIDGRLVGRADLSLAGEDVLVGPELGLFVGSLGRLGRDALGKDVFGGTGLGPGFRGVVGSSD